MKFLMMRSDVWMERNWQKTLSNCSRLSRESQRDKNRDMSNKNGGKPVQILGLYTSHMKSQHKYVLVRAPVLQKQAWRVIILNITINLFSWWDCTFSGLHGLDRVIAISACLWILNSERGGTFFLILCVCVCVCVFKWKTHHSLGFSPLGQTRMVL